MISYFFFFVCYIWLNRIAFVSSIAIDMQKKSFQWKMCTIVQQQFVCVITITNVYNGKWERLMGQTTQLTIVCAVAVTASNVNLTSLELFVSSKQWKMVSMKLFGWHFYIYSLLTFKAHISSIFFLFSVALLNFAYIMIHFICCFTFFLSFFQTIHQITNVIVIFAYTCVSW